jgi:anaerobic magnesium-protoporphyrin IX monomethyl ester cyclase
MTKVLLIRPDQINTKFCLKRLGIRHMPMGLLYVGTTLKNLGVDVKISDEIIGDSPEKDFQEFKPDYVGITIASPLMERATEIIEFVKNKNCKVMLGGPHPTVKAKECLELTSADIIVMSEAEDSLQEIFSDKPLSEIQGIAYRQNGEIIVNPMRPKIEDLDTIPFPSLDLIDIKKYRGDTEMGFHVRSNENSLRIFSTRGCKYECFFCARHVVFGRKVRYRSVENVIEQIKEQSAILNTKKIIFMDDTLTENPERVAKICEEIIKLNQNYIWSCFARVDLSEDLLKLMYRAGCRLIGYGVESCSQKVLDTAKKSITVDDIVRCFHLARKVGMKTKAFIMIGLPGEDEIEFEKSLKITKTLKADYIVVSVFTPLPGSEVYKKYYNTEVDYNVKSFFVTTDPVLFRRQTKFMNQYYFRLGYFKDNMIHFSLPELKYFFDLVKSFLLVRFSKD